MKAPKQLEREHRAEARARLLEAWRKIFEVVEHPCVSPEVMSEHETELSRAQLLAFEWDVDQAEVMLEALRPAEVTST